MFTDQFATLSPEVRGAVDAYIERRLEEKVAELARLQREDPSSNRSFRLLLSKGTLDAVYPPLMMASTAAAMGMETEVFCTQWGLQLLKKRLNLYFDPVGNPHMPVPLPNLVAVMPGVQAAATAMFRRMVKEKNVPSVEELRTLCLESGVRFTACQLSMEVLGIPSTDLIDGIGFGNPGTFVTNAAGARIAMFI
ncbi:MAG: DsrE/DsrF/DrsH-like family protein [Bacillota bacterium]